MKGEINNKTVILGGFDTPFTPMDRSTKWKISKDTQTLNVNGLKAPTKRQGQAEQIQKQDPYIFCLQETHLKTRDTYRLKVKGWKKIFHANGDQKKAGVVILISDKTNFEIKAMKRHKEEHYIMIKGSI